MGVPFHFLDTITYVNFHLVYSECNGDPTITKPGTEIKYPLNGKYGNNERCKWTVDAGKVEVKFHKFNLERGSNRNGQPYDFVEIRHRYDECRCGLRLGLWSHGEGKGWKSLINGKFTIHFSSDYSKRYEGFHMKILKTGSK